LFAWIFGASRLLIALRSIFRHFNILVGPNNAGKSTILAAFRILAAAMRRASSRKAEPVRGPQGRTSGYPIDLSGISIAEENIFYNYDDSQAATIRFTLSNKNTLLLYFPEQGTCYLILDSVNKHVNTPSTFRSHFNCRPAIVRPGVSVPGELPHNFSGAPCRLCGTL
jgi:hypothetical protein